MADEVRGGFDVLFEKLVEKLETYAESQAEANAAYAFEVHADRYRSISPDEFGAHVCVYLGPMTPDPRRSGSVVHTAYDIQYFIDLIANAKGKQDDGDYLRADQAAGARLRYLIQQALSALAPVPDLDFGLGVGRVTKHRFRIEPLPPEMQQGDRPVVGARMIFECSMSWQPEAGELPDLEEIHVDAGLWASHFEIGG